MLQLDPSRVTLYYKEHIKSIKDGSTMKNAEGFKFVPQQSPWQTLQGGPKPEQQEPRKPSFTSSKSGKQKKPFAGLGAE